MFSRREFVKLQAASFVSQSGSHLLTIALAAYVFTSSGSIISSSMIFVLSYMPSVFFSARLGDWIDRKLSKWLLARNELLSIVTSALCGLCIALRLPLSVLCAVVAMRSLLLFIARTAGTKWVKLITPAELQASRIKLFFLSFFLSTAVAGGVASFILARSSIFTVVAVDIVTYCLSLAIIRFLQNPALPVVRSLPSVGMIESVVEATREIFRNQSLRSPFVAVCLSQALFQGAYSVLVSYLPVAKLGLGIDGVGVFQIAASLGITAGFLAVWIRPHLLQSQGGRWTAVGLCVVSIGITTVLGSILVPSVLAAFGSFLLFHFAYEWIWLSNNSEFFRRSPADSLGRYQFTLTSIASFLMAVTTLIYSTTIQYLGLEAGVAGTLLIVVALWIGLESRTAKLPVEQALAGRVH